MGAEQGLAGRQKIRKRLDRRSRSSSSEKKRKADKFRALSGQYKQKFIIDEESYEDAYSKKEMD